jgi:flagellar biosynthesis protein FlhA
MSIARNFAAKGIGTPILLIMMLAMMVVPLPAFALDVFFTFNIALSLIILLACIYSPKPLDFEIFPTVLLVSTLLRLSLNVASTRVVLLKGHNGTDAAGHVIQSFGEVVVGGNYTVGFVVFLIFIIINFVVVTKGAGRISEVSARFTLDAMPGKQMGVDADLNAGIIKPEEARVRRAEIAKEADFYGAMDGASKFVRGDAIAGILILVINLIGGIAIGIIQHEISLSQALTTYGLLTIGDGLVAQVPALILSISAAIIVTRVSSEQDIGTQMFSQLFENPRALIITAAIMAGLGIIPGMPHTAFLGLAAILGSGAYFLILRNKKKEEQQASKDDIAKTQAPEVKELSWDDVPLIDTVGIEIGLRLVPLADRNQTGLLINKIKGVRKKLSQEFGFLFPSVHIRDNLELGPYDYRILIKGVALGTSQVYPEKELALNPGKVLDKIEGITTKDPAFGLEAVWIDLKQKEQAQSLGYTVVDSSTVVATHLSQLLHKNAASLLSHEEAQELLTVLSSHSPKLAESIKTYPLGLLVKILQNLLSEGVPIKDMRTIAATIAEYPSKASDVNFLTSVIRVGLGRLISQSIYGNADELEVVALDTSLEQILHQCIQVAGDELPAIEPGLAQRLQKAVSKVAMVHETNGQPLVLLVANSLRAILAKFLKSSTPNLHVLSYQEIPEEKHLKIVATVSG